MPKRYWPPAGAHRIPRNDTSRMPRRHIVLDTEAERTFYPGGESQTWLCGVTTYDELTPSARHPARHDQADHLTPEGLWEWVAARTKPNARTVLVAHNLAYDLRVSRAIPILTAAGWTLERIRLEGSQTWARFTREKRALVMVDLFSWLLVPLADVGRMVGMPKLELPPPGAELDDVLARCRRDVEITRAAWLEILAWLEREDLGTWQMTGAAMATTAWRHRFLSHKVVATMDAAQHEHEREASYAGRCEVWRHGPQPRARYVEWDLPAAYGQIARDCVVPVFPLELRRRPTPELVAATGEHTGYLVRARVTTDAPLVPTHHDGRVVWPVGTFEGTYWTPELQLLTSRGATWEPLEWWAYRLMPALSGFAAYALSVAGAAEDEHPAVARALAKHWCRALVGRFGMRYRRFEDFGTAPFDDCVVYPMADRTAGRVTRLLHVGRRVQIEGDLQEPVDAVPSIMSWVMAAARVRLWEVAEAAGLDDVLYLDTDSVIVNEAGDRRLRRRAARGELYGIRRKGAWDSLDLKAPRQIVLGRTLRAAGVPKRARPNPDGSWTARVWRGLGASVAAREVDRVVIVDRTLHLRAVDRRREHLADGATAALALTAP